MDEKSWTLERKRLEIALDAGIFLAPKRIDVLAADKTTAIYDPLETAYNGRVVTAVDMMRAAGIFGESWTDGGRLGLVFHCAASSQEAQGFAEKIAALFRLLYENGFLEQFFSVVREAPAEYFQELHTRNAAAEKEYWQKLEEQETAYKALAELHAERLEYLKTLLKKGVSFVTYQEQVLGANGHVFYVDCPRFAINNGAAFVCTQLLHCAGFNSETYTDNQGTLFLDGYRWQLDDPPADKLETLLNMIEQADAWQFFGAFAK